MTPTVVVIGDSLLDVDVLTTADRLTPDGPTPVLDEMGRTTRAGGAALAAALVKRGDPDLDVVLITAVPVDEDGRELLRHMPVAVRVVALPCVGSTSVKSRLRCGSYTVARLDRGTGPLRDVQASAAAREAVADADAILVADYGRGLTHDATLRSMLSDAATRVPLVWDPHPRGGQPVKGTTLVTPNASEAARSADAALATTIASACAQADALIARWQVRAVVVTLGGRGAVLSQGDATAAAFPVPASIDGDACGAGDCFAAVAIGALARRMLASEAVARAVAAATDFLQAGGVAVLDPPNPSAEQQPPHTGLEATLEQLRAQGRVIVATGGCFDLLHAGHVATLTAARRLGDFLIVCLNSDESVRRLKGDSRPLQRAADRQHVLESLRAVDAVVVFAESTPEQVLRRIRPDLWVKGGDYAGQELPEAELVRSWGGRVVSVPYLAGRSTSDLVEQARR